MNIYGIKKGVVKTITAFESFDKIEETFEDLDTKDNFFSHEQSNKLSQNPKSCKF
jgi:hypothetical protein